MRSKTIKKIDLYQYMVYIIFIVVLIFFAVWLGPSFFSRSNLLNITRQTAMVSVMAVAMTFIIASGQIDLSIGAVVALSALISAWLLEKTDSIALALFCALLVGTLVGMINGLLVTYLKIPAFLATLGMMSIIRGSAMWMTATKAITIRNTTFNNVFGMGTIAGVPIVLLWTLIALLIGHVALRYLPYGKKVLAIGGNQTSAFYSGINITRIKIMVFAVMGFASAFAGIIYSARMQTARYTYGEGDEMNVIAAVVLGGTSMAGGSGNIIGAVVGSLLLGVINNGLIIGGLDTSQQQIVRGIIILLAVALSTFNTKERT
ncbi:ABC transporter permease [Lactonifactor longoviformis]|uniref:Ribose transport system permease protein n=1 Tax=Lactonifactor longoviformis DSM 17459 TaxID=1122155 RepID=A0A1M5BM15_9CLOT|nr:ABC transporter permease [Lactonifactor longoviformis]POP31996.1 ABC transporter permease [Lactonifactor longoviformis]SHF43541.1 ribose transport system permease protein [Lactonifactor longoviformis DSM 17459]